MPVILTFRGQGREDHLRPGVQDYAEIYEIGPIPLTHNRQHSKTLPQNNDDRNNAIKTYMFVFRLREMLFSPTPTQILKKMYRECQRNYIEKS